MIEQHITKLSCRTTGEDGGFPDGPFKIKNKQNMQKIHRNEL